MRKQGRIMPMPRARSTNVHGTMDEQQPISPVTSVLLGGAAGSIAEVVVLPALVVRTRMMVQGADRSLTAYSSFGDAIRTMYRTEGVGAFYKGLGLNVLITPLARGLVSPGPAALTSH